MSIQYSDGSEIEQRILGILEAQSDLRSETPIGAEEYDEWAVRYHLCPERSNLLRHLCFDGLDVLELGAGMGGASRYLAETCRSLSVVEGTPARFSALSSRLRDLKGWSGQVLNIQDLESPRKYDVVCAIGVLEYSEIYFKPKPGETAFAGFLKQALGCLKEDGVLILAIENKLGLKYWTGASEDHLGTLFDGICGYPSKTSPKTFSRKELLEILRQVGFGAIDSFFPFPDYKIPCSVLSQELIEKAPGLASELAASQAFEDYRFHRMRYFPDTLALHSLAHGGLLADFANSFLLLACRGGGSSIRHHLLQNQLKGRQIGWHYSLRRKIPTKTVFFQEEVPDSKILSRKEALLPIHSGKSHSFEGRSFRVIWSPLSASKVASGEPLRPSFMRDVYFCDWSSFTNLFKSFIQWSFDTWGIQKGTLPSAPGMLRGKALDATWRNASRTRGLYELFDLEWSLDSEMRKSWFVFRNVFGFISDVDMFSREAPFKSLRELYSFICDELEIEENFELDLESEAEFQSLGGEPCLANSEEKKKEQLKFIFFRSFLSSPFPRFPAIEKELRNTVQRLQAENDELKSGVQPIVLKMARKLNNRLRSVKRAFRD